MIKVENVDVWGFEHAIRGMRNPMNSWSKSDSDYCDNLLDCVGCRMSQSDGCHMPRYENNQKRCEYIIGNNDLDLMRRLYSAGPEHRKYLRQIFVSMDITAPDFWFKEFSTYRIGVTENSTSTMHKIHTKAFELSDFSMEHIDPAEAQEIVNHNERRRLKYLETKAKDDWRALIEGLPMSYNYRRTVTMNYENVVTIIHQRTGHKLSEWGEFIKVLRELPYIKEIIE